MINLVKYKDILDLDWTKVPQVFILVGIFLVSRIPLLNSGFGLDSDAWRIANSALDLKNFLYYEPSRFPGYPLPEFVNSLIIKYGWLATNSLTMILSLISVLVLAKILNELRTKNKGLIVITYAFFPILWINSTTTMDYMWALSFIIFGWYFIIKKTYLLSGLMVGLAIASRPTSILVLAPFFYLIYKENGNIKDHLFFLSMAVVISVLFFLPAYLKFGLNFITFYPSNPTFVQILALASRYIGLLSILFVIIGLILNYNVLCEKIKKNDKFVIFLIIAVISLSIPFLVAPYHIEYLIPAIVFLILFINEIFKKTFFFIVCTLILLPSFVSVAVPMDDDFIDDGLIKRDFDQRNQQLLISELIVSSNLTNSVVISFEFLPVISYIYEYSQKNPKIIGMIGSGDLESNEYLNQEKNVRYVYSTSVEHIEFQKEGYAIYYIGAFKNSKEFYGNDIDEYATNILNVI